MKQMFWWRNKRQSTRESSQGAITLAVIDLGWGPARMS
jgi:hypothetical protein